MIKILLLTVLLQPATFVYCEDNSNKNKAAEAEKVIRQQRELEADELASEGAKSFKHADYSDSAAKLNKAIDLYMRASSSEKRITEKIRKTKTLLCTVYRKYGDATLKEAEERQSAKLFDKAEKLYLLAKKTQQGISLKR